MNLTLRLAVFLAAVAAAVPARAVTIAHDPVPFAVRGQPLTLKAKITGAEEPVATLYYALFRDAAPFRVTMKATGLDYFVGTLDAGLISGVDAISYYIEVQDKSGAITETPWYKVEFRAPEAKSSTALPPPGPAGPAPVIPVSSTPAPSKQDGNWKTPALVAGGAAVVLGGAYLLTNDDGDSDSGDDGGGGGGGTTNDPSGVYNGTVTTCFTPDGGAAACDSAPMSIVVGDNDVVFSETLRPGQQLVGQLVDSSFTLTAAVNENGTNGTIQFEGTLVGTKILGSVSGAATTPGGQGSYTGSFSANKQ